ncbi:hypothetical protein ONZ51_g10275 [Trametes cubensis]|uniref:Retrovirus-related Pol polyprotein from transposon TNT 1-94-like beta-barrel domain-containing protein n=1 Tax=Trametes cubensis TaxID=1111947 RepID=A0AAD7TKY8_9APHY|nr:hypothetical protein ONZ51_g10275 [Trametes cubensis]
MTSKPKAPAADTAATPLPPSTSTPTVTTSQSSCLHDIAFLKNDGSNFTMWKFRISRVLMQHGLWTIISRTEPQPDSSANTAARTNWTACDENTFTQITLTLKDEPLNGVMHLTTSKEVWDKLVTAYEGKGQQTMASLISELFRGTLSNEALLRPQLDMMLHKKHLLTSLGQPLSDSLIAIAMSISLPPSYLTLRTILMAADTTPTTEKVISAVMKHEKMLQNEAKHSALLMCAAPKTTTSKQKPKGNKPKCAHCSKLGHKKDKCCKLKAELEAKQKTDSVAGNKSGDLTAEVTSVSDPSILRIFVADALAAKQKHLALHWIVDSGASAHMSSERAQFVTYHELPDAKRVWFGDNCYILAVGTGSMYLDLHGSDSPVLVSRVFFVPELHGNLLSISRLTTSGYSIKFVIDGSQVVSQASDTVVGTASLQDGLYILNGTAMASDHARIAELDTPSLQGEYDPGPLPSSLSAFVARES